MCWDQWNVFSLTAKYYWMWYCLHRGVFLWEGCFSIDSHLSNYLAIDQVKCYVDMCWDQWNVFSLTAKYYWMWCDADRVRRNGHSSPPHTYDGWKRKQLLYSPEWDGKYPVRFCGQIDYIVSDRGKWWDCNKTSISGTVAGVCVVVPDTPSLPPHLHTTVNVTASVLCMWLAVVALSYRPVAVRYRAPLNLLLPSLKVLCHWGRFYYCYLVPLFFSRPQSNGTNSYNGTGSPRNHHNSHKPR